MTDITNEEHVGNLLAVIHGDGGHYQDEYGTAKAVDDAINKYYILRGEIVTLQEVREQHLRMINDQLATIAVLELKLKEIRALAVMSRVKPEDWHGAYSAEVLDELVQNVLATIDGEPPDALSGDIPVSGPPG